MLREDYEETGAEYTPTLLMSNQKPENTKDKDYIISVSSKPDMEKAYENSMSMVNLMVYMMIGFVFHYDHRCIIQFWFVVV